VPIGNAKVDALLDHQTDTVPPKEVNDPPIRAGEVAHLPADGAYHTENLIGDFNV
jgi:hypothetical protein